MTDEPTVSLPLRDLLGDIKRSIEQIDAKLDEKADRARVHDIVGDVSTINLRLTHLETVIIPGSELVKRLDHLDRCIDGLKRDALTAAQIADAIRKRRGWAWSTAAKVVTTVAAMVAIASTLVAVWFATHPARPAAPAPSTGRTP